jgi:L-2-amino-thiazoline-4-carboxylic acid hydrolase
MPRCPVAEYLTSHDATDLCVATCCNLDFPLARMWGGELERQGTLAGGAGRCDFRFRTHAHAD